MSNELSIREIDFDKDGRPVHCGERMEDDWDMWGCWHCNRYISARAVRTKRDH